MQAVVLERAALRIRVFDLVAVCLLAFNASEYVLAWLRVLYGWLWNILDLPPTPPLALLDPPSPRAVFSVLLTAHIGLVLAVVVAREIAFLAPRISVKPDGLLLQSVFGQRFIPDGALRGLRSVELPRFGFVVWVEAAQGLPLQNGLCLLLFNRWAWRGFVLVSRTDDFDDAVAHIVLRLKQAHGEDEFAKRFQEEKPNELLRVLSAPLATIHGLSANDAQVLSLRQAALQMLSIACSLSVPLLIGALIHQQVPWGALVLPVVAMGEWPLASVYLSALADAYARKLSFQDVMQRYPLTQMPRWPIALALSLAVLAGWPYLLYVPLFIPAIGAGALLTLKLTETLFDIPLRQAALGMLVTIIYQAVVFGLFLAFLPR